MQGKVYTPPNRVMAFRGFSTKTKEWVYGSLLDCLLGRYPRIIFYTTGEEDWIENNHEVYPESVGQFIGLKDKDGKGIYEGDIVGGDPHGTVKVRWCDEYACFEAYWTEQDEREEDGEMVDIERTSLFANELNNCKDAWVVLGNVYEND